MLPLKRNTNYVGHLRSFIFLFVMPLAVVAVAGAAATTTTTTLSAATSQDEVSNRTMEDFVPTAVFDGDSVEVLTGHDDDTNNDKIYYHSWVILQLIGVIICFMTCLIAIAFLITVFILSPLLIKNDPSIVMVTASGDETPSVVFVASERRPPVSTSTRIMGSQIGRRPIPSYLSSYNLYLLFLIIPDVLFNGIIGITMFLESQNGGVMGRNWCVTRNAMGFFYYFANLSLNALVAKEIFTLVKNSYRRIHSRPPTASYVLKQVGVVYTLSMLFSMWSNINRNWSLIKVVDYESCITRLGSSGSDPIFNVWTASVIGVGAVSLPFLYVFYVGYTIKKQNLLPLRGRTRAISIYFCRIVLVFVCFYVPNIAISLIFMNIPLHYRILRYWITLAFTLLAPAQCLTTIWIASMKEDIHSTILETQSRMFRRASNTSASMRLWATRSARSFRHTTLSTGNESSNTPAHGSGVDGTCKTRTANSNIDDNDIVPSIDTKQATSNIDNGNIADEENALPTTVILEADSNGTVAAAAGNAPEVTIRIASEDLGSSSSSSGTTIDA